jgi:putative ABC transport system permease protein
MRILLARLAGLFGRRRRDRDLDDEVRFHLDMMTDDYQRRGLSADDARRAALRHFGGVTQMKETYRDQRGMPVIDTVVQDVKYGVRTLLRTPGFTLAALVTLALGIGANTAIFSVVNAVLLRPLPYPEPDRLVQFMWRNASYTGAGQRGAPYLYFRDHLRSVDGFAAYTGAGSFNLVNGDSAEFVSALYVSKEYFRVFGIHPALGEAFSEEEDRAGGPAVVILTHALWRRHFGEDPSVIGRSILLGDKPVRVVGVMPESFGSRTSADALLPLKPSTTGRGGGANYTVAARLRQDVSIEQASAEVDAVDAALAAEQGVQLIQHEERFFFMPLQESMASTIRPALLMMLAAVGLLLLIASANTASLLLARASGRGKEIAVRAVLGAARGRIVRQLLTESVLLAVAGASIGLVIAYWAVPALLAMTPPGYVITEEVRIDGTVLLVTIGIAVVTGLLFGLAPALSLTRHDLVEAFKDDGGRATAGRGSALLRKALVVAEVAICTLLLVGAGLLIQTFLRLRSIDPGFDPTGVLTARMSLQGERYANPQTLNRFYDEGLDRIRRLPGVRAAAVVNGVPIERALNLNVDVLDGPEKIERALTDWRYATSDYFRAMGIQVIAGRGFSAADRAGAPPVAVVSEEFARRFFKGSSPLGRHIRVFKADGSMEIVGIVRDLKESGLKTRPLAVMYVPVAQTHEAAIRTTHSYFQVSWVVRADNPGPSLVRQIEEEIRALDPKQPFSTFRTMSEVKSRAIATERFQMTLMTAFAAIGLLLAAAGIYGLLAYSVAQRTREFGIRVALGAPRSRILRSVIWTGAWLGLVGVVLGTAAALLVTRTLQNFVWNVSTLDPTTFITVAIVLIVVSAVASIVPALRAVRLDPVTALRE